MRELLSISHTLIVWPLLVITLGGILAYFEYQFIAGDNVNSHARKNRRAWAVGGINFLIGCLFIWAMDYEPRMYYNEIYWWQVGFYVIAMHFGIYWPTYNILLNLFRKKHFLYISDDGQDWTDVKSDTFFHRFGKYGGYVQLLVQILFLAQGIWVVSM